MCHGFWKSYLANVSRNCSYSLNNSLTKLEIVSLHLTLLQVKKLDDSCESFSGIEILVNAHRVSENEFVRLQTGYVRRNDGNNDDVKKTCVL
jgi:hypothetical protein